MGRVNRSEIVHSESLLAAKHPVDCDMCASPDCISFAGYIVHRAKPKDGTRPKLGISSQMSVEQPESNDIGMHSIFNRPHFEGF